jgi:hypothetical protein
MYWKAWSGKTCTNLAPFGQKPTKNDNKLQQVRNLKIVKNPHKSGFCQFWLLPFKAKIRVRFPLAVPEFFRRFLAAPDVSDGGDHRRLS